MAYRLGGGRSIQLSYEGEGGALCGALLPITASVAVKGIGGVGLLPWDSYFGGGVAVLGRGKATSKDSANVVSTQVYKVTLPNPLAQWLPQVV